jgi:mannose-6-phosphate isomerase-like protein (cupin superfamily)
MDIRQFILPSGVGLTHLKVYTEDAPNGSDPGGSAHFHTVCAELYFVLSGAGFVELLSSRGYQKLALEPHQVVCMSPGVIHRLANPNKNLEILVIMQNGGLAERGDYILTFPDRVLADDKAYSDAVKITSHADAITRRNLSLEGFGPLKNTIQTDPEAGRKELEKLYQHARRILAPKVEGFEWVLRTGSLAEVKASHDAVDFIRYNHMEYLAKANWCSIDPAKDQLRSGLCGDVRSYALDNEFMAEGSRIAFDPRI